MSECVLSRRGPNIFENAVDYQKAPSRLGKNFSRGHFEIFVLFFPENRIFHFMQIVGDNLHKMSNHVFWEK